MDVHLVWATGRMFLKPLPRFLLEPRFWTLYLASTEPCSCFRKDGDTQSFTTNAQDVTAITSGAKSDIKSIEECNGGHRACALGFLFSYTALITHESDFRIAKEKHLLPEQLTWSAWITLVKQLDTANIYDKIDERFKYGELRLSRLNEIYRFTRWPPLLGPYMSHWHQHVCTADHANVICLPFRRETHAKGKTAFVAFGIPSLIKVRTQQVWEIDIKAGE